MKLKIIKSAVYITLLAIYSCTGMTTELNSNKNVTNKINNSIVENSKIMESDGFPIKPTAIRLYKRRIPPRPANMKYQMMLESVASDKECEQKFSQELDQELDDLEELAVYLELKGIMQKSFKK